MLFGLEEKYKQFEKLINEGRLSGSYVFFGEKSVGKFSFALELVNFLEKGNYSHFTNLIDARIILPESKIGIDKVKEIKRFLKLKPLKSKYRSVVIDQADLLTYQASNALLKIVEEPPAYSVIILIARNPLFLLETLSSRLTKIYFPTLPECRIKKILLVKYNLTEDLAEKLAKDSFGRLGRAIQLLKQNNQIKDLNERIERIIIKLRKEKKYSKIKMLLNKQVELSKYNLNRKLQQRALELMVAED